MRINKFFSILLLFLSGCYSTSYDLNNYKLDDSVTSNDAFLIQNVMYTWCESTAGDYCPSIDDTGDSDIIIKQSLGNDTLLGLFKTDHIKYNKIFIKDDLDKNTFITVLMHELGHAGGCKHLNDGSVMEEYIEDITEYTITQSMLDCIRK